MMIEYGKKYWVWMCHHVSWGKQKLSRNFNLSIWIWEIFAFINIVWNEEVVGCQERCKGCEQEQRWICGMKPSNVSLILPAPALITVHINYRAVANIGLFEIHFSTVCTGDTDTRARSVKDWIEVSQCYLSESLNLRTSIVNPACRSYRYNRR